MNINPFNDLGTSFESALSSVGMPATNTVTGIVPPPQETIDLVLSSHAILSQEQTLIQVDQDLMALEEKLHTLETLLARDAEISSTLTRKQLQNLVMGGAQFSNLSTADLAAIEAAAAAVEDQLSVLQLRGMLDVRYEFK